MDTKETLAIAALCVLGAIGAYLRPFPMGFDSYFWMTPGLAAASGEYPPLFSLVSQYLFAVPWLTTILACAVIAGLTYSIAKIANTKHPFLAAALLFTAPQFLFRIAEIEDDLVGVPLCLLSLAFYLRWKQNEKDLVFLGAALVAGVLGFLFWRGAAFFALAIALNEARRWSNWLMLVPAGALFYFGFPWTGVATESAFGIYWFVFGLGLLAYCLHSIKVRPANASLFWMSTMFMLLALLRASYLWLLAPFAAILVANELGTWLTKDQLGSAVLGFAVVFGLMFGNVGVLAEHPTTHEMQDVQDVALLTNGSAIANDWQFGHWLRWAGANPLYSNLYPQRELIIPDDAEFVLTDESLTLPLVKNYSSFALYRARQ